MRSKHKFDREMWVVAVTRGRRTRYFFGSKRKEAMGAAGKAIEGAVFSVAKFTRESVQVAERHANGLTEFYS